MEELDLKDLFNIFWNRKIPIILIIVLFIIAGMIYTVKFTTPKYSSSTTLVLASSEMDEADVNTTITTTDITINSKLVSTYSELVKSKNIIREVIGNLQLKIEEDQLRNCIKVNAVKNTELIEITVENVNANEAARIANEIAKVFTKKVKEIYSINNVQIVDEAEIATEPSHINHVKDVMLFFVIGIIIALIYVVIANMLDTTIKSGEYIEKEFDIPVLVSIPKIEKLESERKYTR